MKIDWQNFRRYCAICQLLIAPFDTEKIIKGNKVYHNWCYTKATKGDKNALSVWKQEIGEDKKR